MSEQAAVPSAPSGGDVGADLSASWDAQESSSPESSPEPKSAPAPSAPASSAKPSPSAPTSPGATAGAGAGPARGPDGKFTSQPGDPSKPAADSKSAAPAEFKIPEKWPAEVKAKLQSIHAVNPEHAQFVLEQYEHFRREAGSHSARVQQEIQAKLKPFEDLLAPGRQARALQNMDDATYVRNLIAAGDVLDKNPMQGLRWLAQRYGVDLAQLADPNAQPQQPQMSQAERVALEAANRVNQFLQSQQRQSQDQQLRAASDWITAFASQKDANGQARYPHFDEVLPEIIVNVQYQLDRGEQVDVDAAYKRAVRMNDTVWLKEQTAQTESARKAEEARRLREIEEAKRAGFSASGSGSASSTSPADTLHDEIARHF